MADAYYYAARSFLTPVEVLNSVGIPWRSVPMKLRDAVEIAIDRTKLITPVSLTNEEARRQLRAQVIESVWPEYAPLLEAIADAVKSEKPGQT